MENFKIDQIFFGTYPIEASLWCNQNNAHIEKQEGASPKYKIVKNDKLSDAEKDTLKRERYRAEVDPLTMQIMRLRDEDDTNTKINELVEKRKKIIQKIKEDFENL